MQWDRRVPPGRPSASQRPSTLPGLVAPSLDLPVRHVCAGACRCLGLCVGRGHGSTGPRPVVPPRGLVRPARTDEGHGLTRLAVPRAPLEMGGQGVRRGSHLGTNRGHGPGLLPSTGCRGHFVSGGHPHPGCFSLSAATHSRGHGLAEGLSRGLTGETGRVLSPGAHGGRDVGRGRGRPHRQGSGPP